jgi:hypothetical protein
VNDAWRNENDRVRLDDVLGVAQPHQSPALEDVIDMLRVLVYVVFGIALGLIQGEAEIEVPGGAGIWIDQQLGVSTVVLRRFDPEHLLDAHGAHDRDVRPVRLNWLWARAAHAGL